MLISVALVSEIWAVNLRQRDDLYDRSWYFTRIPFKIDRNSLFQEKENTEAILGYLSISR